MKKGEIIVKLLASLFVAYLNILAWGSVLGILKGDDYALMIKIGTIILISIFTLASVIAVYKAWKAKPQNSTPKDKMVNR